MQLILQNQRITALEAEVKRLRPKKRRKVPNPNKKFMQLAEILATTSQEAGKQEIKPQKTATVEVESDSSDEEEEEEEGVIPTAVSARSGRLIKKPRRYLH